MGKNLNVLENDKEMIFFLYQFQQNSLQEIADKYLSHFIRGYFEGDGSIFAEKARPHYPIIHFVSGSEEFIKTLAKKLELTFGLKKPTIHISDRAKNKAYYFKYFGKNVTIFFKNIYKNPSQIEHMRMERKYSKFLELLNSI